MARPLPLAGSVVFLIFAGCAATQNTLAQDLARERWRKCDHFRGIVLKDIKPDGQIWVWQADGGEVTAWRACDSAVRAEQGKGAKDSLPPSPMTLASAIPNGTANVPTWKRGYEWAYRAETATGTNIFVWSMDREEALDGVPHYVIKVGPREIFYRKSDGAFSRETLDGATVRRITPARLMYVWPLRVGESWEQTMREERPNDRLDEERVDVETVEAQETVTVPAGTFETFKIVCRNKQTGAIRYEMWYAPEVGQWIKIFENLESGRRARELIGFKLR
ncbi:MAG TPA: hypothetical protein VJZ73_13025 [Methylomirabilota bacterium]|nr:hypothetical protein [Methylomirabilota bacterium]